MNKQQIITLIVIGLGVLSVVSIFFTVYLRAGLQKVEIVTVPEDAVVSTPYGEYKQGTHYLQPGEYNSTTSRDGFKSSEQKIVVNENTTILPFTVTPNNELGEKYLEDNPDEVVRYETLGGSKTFATNQRALETYPFLDRLPEINMTDNFEIHYGINEEYSRLAYFVIGKSSTKGRIKAIEWLQNNGVDITKADIRYGEYKSPLIEERTVEGFNS